LETSQKLIRIGGIRIDYLGHAHAVATLKLGFERAVATLERNIVLR
jgi:hypothetical protein